MMNSVRLAHLSDLHINAHDPKQSMIRAQLLFERVEQLRVDHIVITGDLTADATEEEFGMLRELLGSFGLLDPSRLTVVIGNHDVFGGVHLAEDILTFPRRCKDVAYKEQVARFVDAFPEPFQHCLFGMRRRSFPFVKPFGPFLLVGVNTVARHSRMNNPFGSNGEVDDEQFEALQAMFDTPAVKKYPKLVLLHHHFSKREEKTDGTMHSLWSAIEQQTMKLRKKKRLISLFLANDVRAILHGHVHENFEYQRKGLRFINGGGSILGPQKQIISLNLLVATQDDLHVRQIDTVTPDRHGPHRIHTAIDSLPQLTEPEIQELPRIAVNGLTSA